MLYIKETEITNILTNSLVFKNSILEMREFINNKLAKDNHPFICVSISSTLTDDEYEVAYFLENTDEQYEDVSGVIIA